MPEFVPVAEATRLTEGSMLTVDVKGRPVLIAMVGGRVLAVSATCTHESTDLGQGFLLEDRVVCPLHLSQFDLKSGEAVNPPAEVPLDRFNVQIREGTVFVEV